MKFTNISNKVIGIGGVNVMPDESTTITEEVAQLPAVQAYVRLKMVTLEPDSKKATRGKGGQGRSDNDAESEAAAKKAEEEAAKKAEEEAAKKAAEAAAKKAAKEAAKRAAAAEAAKNAEKAAATQGTEGTGA